MHTCWYTYTSFSAMEENTSLHVLVYCCREFVLQAPTLKARQELSQLVADNPQGLPSLDPMRDLKLNDMQYVEMREEKEQFESTMPLYRCINCPDFEQHVS